MALDLKGPWSVAITVGTTLALVAGAYVAREYLKNTPSPQQGSCEDSYYADAIDCLAKDKNGNPISISIDTPETPSP